MKVKICGLSKSSEVETSINYGANYCGFILNYPKSHRNISLEQAKNLTNIYKKNSKYVGVLVNPSQEELKIFSDLDFDYFQLYGNYNDEAILEIKKKYGKKIIFGIQVQKERDVMRYKEIENSSDIILWDSSGYENSLSWNYNWVGHISIRAEKMIAGNITIDILKHISQIAQIVDVYGALETNKVKDINKIIRFLTYVKKINDEN